MNKETANATKQLDELNMELAALCFRIVLSKQTSNLSSSWTFQLEMSILYFLQCFQYLLIESRTRAQVAKAEARARRLPVYRDAFPNIQILGSDVMPALVKASENYYSPLLPRPSRSFEKPGLLISIEEERQNDISSSTSSSGEEENVEVVTELYPRIDSFMKHKILTR